MNIRELINYARAERRAENDDCLVDLIESFEGDCRFLTGCPEVSWRGWVYHVPVPKDEAKIQYRDVKMDHSAYDYDRIVAHAVRQGRAILVNQALYPFDPLKPMYERVRAMTAYVHSQAFNSPTVFLDGDAFVNTDLTGLFETIDDVAVTYRSDPGLMPINEGVIFAKPTEGTKAFFRAYLATYDRLSTLETVLKYYSGDIKRWRGGQLSLNALACPEGIPSDMDRSEVFGCKVQYLPCHIWNFSPDGPQTRQDLDAKAILHLKGPRKQLVDQIIKYQEGK